jgi:hypothetical protein
MTEITKQTVIVRVILTDSLKERRTVKLTDLPTEIGMWRDFAMVMPMDLRMETKKATTTDLRTEKETQMDSAMEKLRDLGTGKGLVT